MDTNPWYKLIGKPRVVPSSGVETYLLSGGHTTLRSQLDASRSAGGSGPSSSPEDLLTSERAVEYLANLSREKAYLKLIPLPFPNLQRLAEEEISRVRNVVFQGSMPVQKVDLPEPEGERVVVQEKVYIPWREHPEHNFVGRILGPRGMTAKQLEQETGCKIMVRGRGSLRDHHREQEKRGEPNWEHLDDDLHVLVQCEDSPNRVHTKLRAGVELIKKLLVPVQGGMDDLKRKQLLELAIINGTYKPNKQLQSPRSVNPVALVSPIGQPHSPMPAQSVMRSLMGVSNTQANHFGGSSMSNSLMQSPTTRKTGLMALLSSDAAGASSKTENGEHQPQTSSSMANTTELSTSPQSYFLDSDSTTYTPK